MRKFWHIFICLLLIVATSYNKSVKADEVPNYNNLNNGFIQFNGNTIRENWLDLPITSYGDAVNSSGNLNNPYYFNGSSWWPLTLFRPMEWAIAEGGTLVSADDPYTVTEGGAIQSSTRNGSISLSDFTVDGSRIVRTELATTAGDITYSGTLTSTGKMTVNGKNLEITNTYTLPQGKSFIKVTTKITNRDTVSASNVRYWVGTGDDWISTDDTNNKTRGNIVGSDFVASSGSSGGQAKAVKVDSTNDSVLFYSTHPNANTSVSGCCDFMNAVNINPKDSTNFISNDGSYALFVNLGSIAPSASAEFDWYYAAGTAASILETISAVADAAATVGNVTSDSVTLTVSTATSATGHYIVVPRGSQAPTAEQVYNGATYSDVAVSQHGSITLEANTPTELTIGELSPGTQYDVYFVTRSVSGETVTYGNVTKTEVDTPLPIISTATITDIAIPEKRNIPDTVPIETDSYTATVSWSPDHATFQPGVSYAATITITPKTGFTLTGLAANTFKVTGATVTHSANSGILTATYPTLSMNQVHFNDGNGNITSVEYEYNAKITEPTPPTREGYDFLGWFEDEAYQNAWDFATGKMSEDDMTLYGKWQELDRVTGAQITSIDVPRNNRVPDTDPFDTDSYTATISWSPNHAKFEAGVSYTATITVTPKNGKTLIGLAASTFTVTGATVTHAANSGVITAVYPAVVFDSVHFNDGNGIITSVGYDYESKIAAPEIPIRAGYVFSGWYQDEAYQNAWDFEQGTMPLGDLNLYAKWTIIEQPHPRPRPTPQPTVTPLDIKDVSADETLKLDASTTHELNGTKKIEVRKIDRELLKYFTNHNDNSTVDGNNTTPYSIDQLRFTMNNSGDTTESFRTPSIAMNSEGTLVVSNLTIGTNVVYDVTYDLGNNQKIVVGKLNIMISQQGETSFSMDLIDPYGTITDTMTGQVIEGADVTLYYADTQRNRDANKEIHGLVQLPILDGFQPNNNKNPQMSSATGEYAFMVFPNTDYYLIINKKGYQDYISSTISVDKEIVKWDVSMTAQKAPFILATKVLPYDKMVGEALAAKLGSTLYQVGNSSTEINKLIAHLKKNVAKDTPIYIIGSPQAVFKSVETAIIKSGYVSITRFSGKDKYQTAQMIAHELTVRKGQPVILTSGEKIFNILPQAVTLNKKMKYPLLYTQNKTLLASTKKALLDLKPNKIYVVGDEKTISTSQIQSIMNMLGLTTKDVVWIKNKNHLGLFN